MKRTLLFLSVCALTTLSCSEHSQNLSPTSPDNPVYRGRAQAQRARVAALAALPKTGTTSQLTVRLEGLDGSVVGDLSALKANTSYKVVVSGAREIQVRACLGCDMVEEADRLSNQRAVNTFTIKTGKDVLESPVVSVIPLGYQRGSTVREQAQMLTLVK